MNQYVADHGDQFYKPIRLSTLTLLKRLINPVNDGGWGVMKANEMALVVTANKVTLTPRNNLRTTFDQMIKL